MKILSSKVALGFPDEPVVFCPGCQCLHRFNVKKPNEITGAQWQWNGDTERPSFSPSLIVNNANGKGDRCHSFLKDGKWQFLGDCTHSLVGHTVDLPDLPPWVNGLY